MKMQVIEKNGKPEWAIIPYEEYQRLIADSGKRKTNCNGEGSAPRETVVARFGENRIRAWRHFRNMTQTDLADRAQIGCTTLANIETGKVAAGHRLAAIAEALDIKVEDLAAST